MSKAAGNGLLVVAALFGLAGCEQDPYVAPEASRLMTTTDALALPPPGGPSVVGVLERRYSNARAQEVSLATLGRTPGQNRIEVAVLGTGRPRGDDVLLTPAFTDAAIAQEMRAALPGVAMTISPFFASNVYGAFGYAFGRGAGNDLCLYGWQRIDSAPRPFARSRVVSARMRLCEPGATEASLLANMQGYTLNVPLDVHFHAARPAGTSAPGGGLQLRESVLGAPEPAPAPPPRARRTPAAVARAEPPAAPALSPANAPTLPPAVLDAVPPAPSAPSVAGPIVPPPPIEIAPPAAPLSPVPLPPPPAVAPPAPMVQAPPAAPSLYVSPPSAQGVASAAILPEIAE